MTLLQLTYFLELCQTKNYTRAANNLHISQPSITRTIQSLESEFHCILFQRTPSGLTLTNAGNCLSQLAAQLIDSANEITKQMEIFREDVPSTLRIGFIPSLSSFVANYLKQNCTNGQAFHYSLVEDETLRLLSLLESGDLDAAFLCRPEKLSPREFYFFPLLKTDLCFCTNRSNTLACHTSITPEIIGSEPLSVFSDAYSTTKLIQERFKNANITPNIVQISRSCHSMKAAIKLGLYSGFLFRDLISDTEDIIAIPLSPPIDTEIGLLMNPSSRHRKDILRFQRQLESSNNFHLFDNR